MFLLQFESDYNINNWQKVRLINMGSLRNYKHAIVRIVVYVNLSTQ